MPAAKVAAVISTLTDPFVTTLLGKISEGKHVISVPKGEAIFSQGDRADAIYFVQSGRVKVSVVSSAGKEAVLEMLGPHGLFGEGSLVGQPLRLGTATALEPVTLFQVEKRAMLRALREQVDLSGKFMSFLLTRKVALEEDLCDQLFNDSEKRLARVLLKLVRLHVSDGLADLPMPTVSHETLAEMVGTTRSRITHFMNKFRNMGLIEYKGHLTVRTDLLANAVLCE
jgi:CRP/FNR family cyclic AMP-dependent transcriptional regulator